jgi:2-polyprenyl-3-methyl-5-hydroxy-6-metoxy-1,4-benzoquinol methylase
MNMDKLSNGRIVPDNRFSNVAQNLLYLRHLAAYNFAKEYVKDKAALEVGCGTGYGAHYLSQYAHEIEAVDTAEDAIQYSKSHYSEQNIHFSRITDGELPFDDRSFDVALSFQVIEHIEKRNLLQWLLQIRRVLKDKCIFIVSTPNKKLRLLPLQKPWNANHKKEYSRDELAKILEKVFAVVEIYGLSANEGVLSLERNRVKQKPLNAYVLQPLLRVTRGLSLPEPTRSKKPRAAVTSHERSLSFSASECHPNAISLADFVIDATCSNKRSIDLIGVCQKK